MAIPDRTQAPDFQLSTDYSLAQPEQFHSGTVPVFAFRQISQEAVRIELLFDAGKWHEPGPGISHFASQLLSKGTRHRNAFAVAEGFESLGAHLEVSPGYDITTVALFALRKNVVEAMKLLGEVLTEPAFDEEELRIMKEIFLQNLRVQNEKTSVVASKEIRKAIFGGSHPYGSSLEEHQLTGLGTIALRDYYQKHFKLRAVFIVGRLDDQVLREVMHLLPPSPPIVTPAEHIPHPGRSLTLRRENSVQASIRLGALFPQKQHSAEHFATVLVNHILGGFFGSRLMKNIREEKGLTYGIYSSINHFERSSCWVIGAEVNQQNADQALVEIRKEIEVLRSVAVPVDELENARNYFIGSWQSENATLFSVSDKIKGLFLAGLTPAYYTDLLRFVSSCSSAQLLEAAHHHFDPARLIEVRVG
ncbi:MAG TPA: pitrilysin family protein [Cyclobacteriaceae bacterium]|nr:pitrilysin family protein [Cyclobacteriaceae bacterium]